MQPNIIIDIMYDEEHKVYLGSSEQVRGQHVSCETLEEVFEVVKDVLPELVANNLTYDIKHGHMPLYNIAKYAESRV